MASTAPSRPTWPHLASMVSSQPHLGIESSVLAMNPVDRMEITVGCAGLFRLPTDFPMEANMQGRFWGKPSKPLGLGNPPPTGQPRKKKEKKISPWLLFATMPAPFCSVCSSVCVTQQVSSASYFLSLPLSQLIYYILDYK